MAAGCLVTVVVAGCSSGSTNDPPAASGASKPPVISAPSPTHTLPPQPAQACTNFRIEAPRINQALATLKAGSGDVTAARTDLSAVIAELRDWTAAAKSTSVGGDLGALLGDLTRANAATNNGSTAAPALNQAIQGVADLAKSCAAAAPAS